MNKYRSSIILSIAIASTLVLGKSIFNPELRSSAIDKFTFPESIPLPQSQFIFSGAVNPHLVQPPAYISGKFVAGKHYRYLHDEQYLDIEMRYLKDTDGDLKSYITNQTGELLPTLKQDKKRGFYSLYSLEDKTYLSACIHPLGGTTVTNDQFHRNRIGNFRVAGIFPWLLGKAELKDKRCLWAHLSLSNNSGKEQTARTLETVWFNWYDEWRSQDTSEL